MMRSDKNANAHTILKQIRVVICSLTVMAFSLQAQDELVDNQKREVVREEEGDAYNEENGEQVRRMSSLMFVEYRCAVIRFMPCNNARLLHYKSTP